MSDNLVTAPPGENWFTIVRGFAAPAALLYKCYTEPQHMAHFWGPRNSTLAVCRIDLRVGGVWRVEWKFANGDGWGYSSVYTAIAPNRRLDYRDAPEDWTFGLDGLPAPTLVSSITLDADGPRTLVTVRVECVSVAAREEAIRRGFAGMVGTGHDRLAEYLASIDPATV